MFTVYKLDKYRQDMYMNELMLGKENTQNSHGLVEHINMSKPLRTKRREVIDVSYCITGSKMIK